MTRIAIGLRFDEGTTDAADVSAVALEPELLAECEHPLIADLLRRVGHVVDQRFGRVRRRTRVVLEDVVDDEGLLFEEALARREVLVRFTRETDDPIAAQFDVGNSGAQDVRSSSIEIGRITALHRAQDRVGA